MASQSPPLSPPERVTVQAWASDVSASATTANPRGEQFSLAFRAAPSDAHAHAPSVITAPGPIRGTGTPLSIPLDERRRLALASAKFPRVRAGENGEEEGYKDNDGAVTGRDSKVRREPLRRDSLKRREALLKGKEGSRRRQRWENDRLLSNPHAQPPLPSDWVPHPTHRRTVVPYFLAPLWDVELSALRREKEEEKVRQRHQRVRERNTGFSTNLKKRAGKHRSAGAGSGDMTNEKKIGKAPMPLDEGYGLVPRDLRRTLKRAKGAKGLLVELEEEVRKFVVSWEKKKRREDNEGMSPPVTPIRVEAGAMSGGESDEEIVFVGRGGAMKDVPASPVTRKRVDSKVGEMEEVVSGVEGMEIDGEEGGVEREKLVFGAPAGDKGATFGRWLVHSIASYYGLKTWSVTIGNPARREAYVGIKALDTGRPSGFGELPRPLYVMV